MLPVMNGATGWRGQRDVDTRVDIGGNRLAKAKDLSDLKRHDYPLTASGTLNPSGN